MAFIDVTLLANGSSISPAQVVQEVVLESLDSLDDERFELLHQFARQCSIAELLEKAQQIGAIPPHRDLQNQQAVYERITQFQGALQLYQVPSLPIEVHQYYALESLPNNRERTANTSPSPEADSPMRGVGPGFEYGGHSCCTGSRQSRDDNEHSRKSQSSGSILIERLADLHLIAFACIMLKNVVKLAAGS
ncbi:hypothetical protein [Bradyrhizobium sp. Cp5.3]|uniref:hypothetical protein n=1 Tax=Bradyrhizobium sp. Cp5.3 TaxID=443598 RepID=UPI0012EC6A7F|nr:hypothetical protein [Bradyrhizobium sp. Cp5.3]